MANETAAEVEGPKAPVPAGRRRSLVPWGILCVALLLLAGGMVVSWQPVLAHYWFRRLGRGDQKASAKLTELGDPAIRVLVSYIENNDPTDLDARRKHDIFKSVTRSDAKFWGAVEALASMGRPAEDAIFRAVERAEGHPDRLARLYAALRSFNSASASRAYARALGDGSLQLWRFLPAGKLSAVEEALWNLNGRQKTSGAWPGGDGPSAASEVEVTGWALLAYLGAGYTHERPARLASTVSDAQKFLLAAQRPDGRLGTGAIRAHAVAGLALSESYGMTKDPNLAPPVTAAVKWTESAQLPTGGWPAKPGGEADARTTALCTLFLKGARNAGLPVAIKSFQLAAPWTQREIKRGNAKGGGPRPEDTAAVWLTRWTMGYGRKDRHQTAMAANLIGRKEEALKDSLNAWFNWMGQFYTGGTNWRTWDSFARKKLLDSQFTRGQHYGGWPVKTPETRRLGRSGTTALNVLCLEIYYRYLPIYAR